MKDASIRIAHYTARVNSTLMTPTVLAVNNLQRANFASRTRLLYDKQVATIEILNNAGVATVTYPFYIAFSAKLGRYWLSSAGESLAKSASLEVALYVARGLEQSILQAIRTDVWNIAAPMA